MIKVKDLPAPRLELRWVSDTRCNYGIVIPVDEHDIRWTSRNKGLLFVKIGAVKVTGGARLYPDAPKGERIYRPFRHGAHAKWDSLKMNLPAFVTYCGDAERILP